MLRFVFEPGSLPFGFAVTDFPPSLPVSGSCVSILVPLRDNDIARCLGLRGEGHDLGEEPGAEELCTEIG